jgi:hypothetical protein
VGWALGTVDFWQELCVEEFVGVHRDCRQNLIAIGEVGVWGAYGDTEAPACLGQREGAYPPLGDELNSDINQR